MDWETARSAIWSGFNVLLSVEDTIRAMEEYSEKYVKIYSMDAFDSFCRDAFHGKYLQVVSAVLDGKQKKRFDTNDYYFVWYPEEEKLISCNYIPDLVEDREEFVKNLLRYDAKYIYKMGYIKSIVEEMKKALKEEKDR